MSAVDLLPCPFCGGNDIVRLDGPSEDDWVSYKCQSCHARGQLKYSDRNAAAAWNTRAHPAPAMEAEPVAWTTQFQLSKIAKGGSASCWSGVEGADWIPLYAHPQDAESLRGEVEGLRQTVKNLNAAWASCIIAREEAEDERDAALARVAELEAEAASYHDAYEGEKAGRATEIACLTPQPDAEVEALVDDLGHASRQIEHTGPHRELLKRAAAALRPVGGVKVKPPSEEALVWIDQPNYSSALTTDGLFYLADATGYRRCVAGEAVILDQGPWHPCEGLDAAKAAAQADYEARIRAALTPQPDAGLDALVARLEGPVMQSARDLIASYFKQSDKCLASIPARPDHDADLVLTAGIRDAITAFRSRPVGEVKVEPLVWHQREPHFWAAEGVGGMFYIHKYAGRRNPFTVRADAIGDGDFPTLEAAKAAAQADYEARIRSALSPASLPQNNGERTV